MEQKATNDQWFCKICIKDSACQHYNLTVFHREMVKLFKTQGKRLLSTLSTDEVEDILLDTTDL
jgi:hypothetical protein